MSAKFQALLHTRTWDLFPPSLKLNSLGCNLFLKTKRHFDDTHERRKDHLVANDFHQQSGLAYSKTFSLVIKLVTILFLLSIAITKNWPLH